MQLRKQLHIRIYRADHWRIERKLAGLPTGKVETIENLARQIAEESEFLDGPRRSAHRDHESFSESRL